MREVIEGCANPVAVFLPNYPLNKQQLDVMTSEVNISLYSLIVLAINAAVLLLHVHCDNVIALLIV